MDTIAPPPGILPNPKVAPSTGPSREEETSSPPKSSSSIQDFSIGSPDPDNDKLDATVHQLSWQVLKKTSSESDLEGQLRQFVNTWCRLLAADQVFLVLGNKQGTYRVAAVSGMPSFDSRSQIVRQIEDTCNSKDDPHETEYWLAGNRSNSNHRTLETIARANGYRSAVLLPMSIEADPAPTAYVVTFKNTGAFDFHKTRKLVAELFPLLAEQFSLETKTRQSWFSFLSHRLGSRFARSKPIVWLTSLVLFVVAGFIPMSHKISCDSTLEPTLRRFIASPFDGKLKKSFVEPGVRVKANEILAVMDDVELQLELESVEAELSREKERHGAALQESRVSDAQISKLEIDKLEHEITRLKHRISNLEIRTPMAGMVVSGDLEKSEGTPLTKGQSLFEIGPIDELNIEIEVPEPEIRFLKIGQQVTVRFHAFPLDEFKGKIEQVFPRAEIRNQNAVFVAVAKVSNPDGRLRPGMKGKAQILAGPSTLGWNILHRPVERVRSLVGW